jgi:hypothetical protein
MNLFGIVCAPFNEAQAGIDHRQKASEVMSYTASHFTDSCKPLRCTFALQRSGPGIKRRARCP